MAPPRVGLINSRTVQAESEARALAEGFNKSLPKDAPMNTLVKAMITSEGTKEEREEQIWTEVSILKAVGSL